MMWNKFGDRVTPPMGLVQIILDGIGLLQTIHLLLLFESSEVGGTVLGKFLLYLLLEDHYILCSTFSDKGLLDDTDNSCGWCKIHGSRSEILYLAHLYG